MDKNHVWLHSTVNKSDQTFFKELKILASFTRYLISNFRENGLNFSLKYRKEFGANHMISAKDIQI